MAGSSQEKPGSPKPGRRDGAAASPKPGLLEKTAGSPKQGRKDGALCNPIPGRKDGATDGFGLEMEDEALVSPEPRRKDGETGGSGLVQERNWNCLLKFNEVPNFAREVSITTGYRHTLGYTGCLKSIFWIHNETVNIWSHFLGFCYFAYLLQTNLSSPQPHVRNNLDLVAVGVQLISYQVCMLLSSLFHTFLCHSEDTKHRWQEADHAGILVAIWGTYARLIVTKFSCFPSWQACHLVVITTIFSLVFLKIWRRHFRGDKRRGGVELHLLLALALYAVAPFTHWISISPYLVNHNVTSQKILWMFFPYSLGGLGLFFYLSRVPERWVRRGQVDLWGSSHQIWHVLILAGMISWYELTCWLSETRPQTCQLSQLYASNSSLSTPLSTLQYFNSG